MGMGRVADPGCLSRIPDPNFSIPDSWFKVKNIPDPGPISVFLTHKIVSKLSEIWSWMFIPDPDLDLWHVPDPGVKKASDPRYGFQNKEENMFSNLGHPKVFNQCWGSGSESGSGSTRFWASRIRIHYSEVWIRIRILLWIRILILLSSCKNSKKTLIPTILWLFWTFYLWKMM